MYIKNYELLNEYQKKAVEAEDMYSVLNAQVGSGKTTVLIHKVLFLNIVKKIPLDDIMVLTFTNKAAGEIRDRIKIFENEINGDIKYLGTFHSVANKLLRERCNIKSLGYSDEFQVIDTEKSVQILEDIIKSTKLSVKYKNKIKKRIEEYKLGKSLYGVMKHEDDIGELITLFNERKVRDNLMDFDDVIENCINLMDNPINPKWVIVDEFQDTDIRQLSLIKKIAGKDTHIFVIGDPNQIIYSFRNGETNIFKSFYDTYSPKEYTLPINYRCSKTIVEAANAFIGKGEIKATNDYDEPIIIRKHYDAFNEALHIANKIKELNREGISFKDIAVLHRRVSQGDIISSVFDKEDIPYVRSVKGLDSVDNVDKKAVNLLTMHTSKGLEFSYVFITGANMGNIPITTKRCDEMEETRLFFVAMTRAKKYLEISYLIKPDIKGVTRYMSPYISVIPDKLKIYDDLSQNITLKDIITSIREEREKKIRKQQTKIAVHNKYGEGKVIFEDENVIRVEFEGYGEKEFSKLFCQLEIKEL